MVRYDSRVLQQFAEMLYTKAQNIVITYAVLGLVLGGIVGLVLKFTVSLGRDLSAIRTALTWAPPLLGLAAGISTGRMKAFMLRLEAQRTLCQLQIETNTRAQEGLAGRDDQGSQGKANTPVGRLNQGETT